MKNNAKEYKEEKESIEKSNEIISDEMQKLDKKGFSKADQIAIKKVEILIDSVNRVYPTTKHLMFRSFIQGVFVGLGTTIGVAVVLGLLTFLIGQLNLIPGVGDFIKQTKIETVLPVNK